MAGERQVGSDRMCGANQVRVSLWVGPVPAPDTSHPRAWVRTHGHGSGYSEPGLVAFTSHHIDVHVRQAAHSSIVDVRVVLTFPHMYVAQEMRQYPGAVERIANHEANHPRSWEQILASQMPNLCTDINSQIYSPVANHAQLVGRVDRIAHQAYAQWIVLLRQNADIIDRDEYPQLHQDLTRLNVPSP